MSIPLPLAEGTYEICAGTTRIGDAIEVEASGRSVCRVKVPTSSFLVDQGVNDSLENLTVEADTDGKYALSLECPDSEQNPLPAPGSLQVPAAVTVTGGISEPFSISAINPQPEGGQMHWVNVIVKADGASCDCGGVFDYDIDDGDGVVAGANCPKTPNGPALGTCVKTKAGMVGSYRVGGQFITCDSNEDCQATGGTCQMEPRDCNDNGCGDVCECYAEYKVDGFVDGGDLAQLKRDYGKTCPCLADGNDDGFVDGGDLVLLKNEYGRIDCPALP